MYEDSISLKEQLSQGTPVSFRSGSDGLGRALTCSEAGQVSGGAWPYVLHEDGVEGVEGGQGLRCFAMVTQQLLERG